MWVVKIGGSLNTDPLLPEWLELLVQLGGGRVTLVCGGGGFADEVRRAQTRWRFDDLAAHNMAVLAMAQSAYMAWGLNPKLQLATNEAEIRKVLHGGHTALWLPNEWLRSEPDRHTNWDNSGDSIALDLARSLNAERLVVVKSCAIEPTIGLPALADAGILDRRFVGLAEGVAFPIDVIQRAELARMRGLLLGETRANAELSQSHRCAPVRARAPDRARRCDRRRTQRCESRRSPAPARPAHAHAPAAARPRARPSPALRAPARRSAHIATRVTASNRLPARLSAVSTITPAKLERQAHVRSASGSSPRSAMNTGTTGGCAARQRIEHAERCRAGLDADLDVVDTARGHRVHAIDDLVQRVHRQVTDGGAHRLLQAGIAQMLDDGAHVGDRQIAERTARGLLAGR